VEKQESNLILLSILNEILEEAGRKPITDLQEEMDLRIDLGMDSLMLAELTVRIESEYHIDIFEDSLVESVGDIMLKMETQI
jgi:acyl carrier protein